MTTILNAPTNRERDRCRLSDIPSDWFVKRLGAVAKTEYGISESASDSPNAEMIGMKHLTDGGIDFNGLIPISVSEQDFQRYHVSNRDLFFNRTNSLELVGKTSISVGVPHDRILFASYLVRIHTDETQLLPEFANYFMNSHIGVSRIKTLATPGVGQYNVNPTSLRNQLLIPLPPLPEQQKIAAILSTWDRAIELMKKLITTKQKRKQALMQQLLTGKDVKPIALSSFLKPTQYPVTKPIEPYTALGIRSHCKGTFHRHVDDPSSVAMDTLYAVKQSELIVNITFAWEGAIAVVKPEDEGCFVSHRFPTYAIDPRIGDIDFIRHLVTMPRFIFQLGFISPGGAGRNRVMSKKDFLKLKVPLPSIKKQQRIGKVLMTATKEIELLSKRLDALLQQKKGLMQQLLTGKLRLDVAYKNGEM